MSEKIKLIARGLNVAPIYWALQANSHLWNEFTSRTASTDSPHHGLDDIWARFSSPESDKSSYSPAVWYPSAEKLGIKDVCLDIMRANEGVELGGVLITRIPPGAECKPHEDHGWHARYYEKFALQITSAPGQKFCFEGEELETMPGDLFWFDNQYTHWVKNDTPYERVTMIICIRKEH